MECWSPDLSPDSGCRQGDKAPEGTRTGRTSTVQWSCAETTGRHQEMERSQLTRFVRVPLPQPPAAPSSDFPFPLQSLSSGGSQEGLVRIQLAGLHPLTSWFPGLTGIQVILMRLVMGAHSEHHCSRQKAGGTEPPEGHHRSESGCVLPEGRDQDGWPSAPSAWPWSWDWNGVGRKQQVGGEETGTALPGGTGSQAGGLTTQPPTKRSSESPQNLTNSSSFTTAAQGRSPLLPSCLILGNRG